MSREQRLAGLLRRWAERNPDRRLPVANAMLRRCQAVLWQAAQAWAAGDAPLSALQQCAVADVRALLAGIPITMPLPTLPAAPAGLAAELHRSEACVWLVHALNDAAWRRVKGALPLELGDYMLEAAGLDVNAELLRIAVLRHGQRHGRRLEIALRATQLWRRAVADAVYGWSDAAPPAVRMAAVS